MYCTVEPCASARAFEIRFVKAFDMENVKTALGQDALSVTPVVILAKIRGKPVSIYASGRAMIKDCSRTQAQEVARRLCQKLGVEAKR